MRKQGDGGAIINISTILALMTRSATPPDSAMPAFKRVQIGELELCYQESEDGDRPLLPPLADIRILWVSPSLVRHKRGTDLVEAMLSDPS